MSTLQRMWIDQPSTHQQHHDQHGKCVLAKHEYGATMRVYFLEGDIVSMQMSILCLSEGWPLHLRHPKWEKKHG